MVLMAINALTKSVSTTDSAGLTDHVTGPGAVLPLPQVRMREFTPSFGGKICCL